MSCRRKFIVHLLCRRDAAGGVTHFVTRIHSWASRACRDSEIGERIFEDECEFIETVNSVLPKGSDVRNIFTLIESSDGFYYLLKLGKDEARRLGGIDGELEQRSDDGPEE